MTDRTTVSKLGRVASTPRLDRYSLPFVWAGALPAAGIISISPPWRPREAVVITGSRLYLGVGGQSGGSPNRIGWQSGAGPGVVTIRVNGVPINVLAGAAAETQISFPMVVGPCAVSVSCYQLLGPSDTLTVQAYLPPVEFSLERVVGVERELVMVPGIAAADLTVIVDFG